MLVLNSNQVKIFLLAVICVCGLSVGFFAAQLAGILIEPPTDATAIGARPDIERSTGPAVTDTNLIVQKNIFNPEARGKASEPVVDDSPEPVRTVAAGDLKLFGTVEGGKTPLALIEHDGDVKIYHIGDNVPGGGELIAVKRNEALIRQADGSRVRLTMVKPDVLASTPSPTVPDTPGDGIRSLGDNRWVVSREEVDRARSNLNQLLKSARMEPNIVNGQTEGFVVKMVRPRSLLAQLGIRRGDTVTRVNGVELNSPEKALQIFQQLREAKRLTVDLVRGNENLTFDYEVN